MSTDKSELRKEIAHHIGCKLDDALEESERDIYRWDGAKSSLSGAKLAVEKLLAHIAQDVKTQKLSAEAAEAAQTYVVRAASILDNLRLKAEVHEQRAHGKTEAFKLSVAIAKKYHDDEEAKAKARDNYPEELPADPSVPRPARPIGTRPAARSESVAAVQSGSDAPVEVRPAASQTTTAVEDAPKASE